MSVKITYIYSACVLLETQDVKILCDPWFSDGAYDGSWYHYPRMENPVETIGRADLIYISHIHPDHYDPKFLKLYLKKYPETKIIVAPFEKNMLAKRMGIDQIPHEIVSESSIGGTRLSLIPNERAWFDVDSALVLQHNGHSVVNMNDNFFNESQINRINEIAPSIQIALLPYAGAGPYPHTYYDIGPTLIEKASLKRQQFFDRYLQLRDALEPEATIPFAGKYYLGGHLHNLNPYRGVSDAVEVSGFDSTAMILQDGGNAWVDTKSLQPSAVRSDPYDVKELEAFTLGLSEKPMHYEVFFNDLDVLSIPFSEMLSTAYKNAVKKFTYQEDYWFCLKLQEEWFVMNCNAENPACRIEEKSPQMAPRSEIYIDLKYLYGLLTGTYHWSNAEVGSQFMTRRYPDVFNEEVQNYLNFLHL
ncbi:MAG: MBL fold metallo-hydrolase [Nitrospina sp.]|jgi:UDP-MurNAc hydroxylase|nr:MBL fold metallo-hydrolase [Nitrospina sp.]MBT3413581.1 MBL fold metallo-hydrolase [Nitrospina sp.]MBT3857884.1 MBL fold metallo-hydrolase [Nitrospina sp.]MBT4104876.1 MBL fold metallo-hydrolase [Nitrospina sp.]MBT4390882.1 MBL fold metallo-hydrolase [Nitrospina sp.]